MSKNQFEKRWKISKLTDDEKQKLLNDFGLFDEEHLKNIKKKYYDYKKDYWNNTVLIFSKIYEELYPSWSENEKSKFKRILWHLLSKKRELPSKQLIKDKNSKAISHILLSDPKIELTNIPVQDQEKQLIRKYWLQDQEKMKQFVWDIVYAYNQWQKLDIAISSILRHYNSWKKISDEKIIKFKDIIKWRIEMFWNSILWEKIIEILETRFKRIIQVMNDQYKLPWM